MTTDVATKVVGRAALMQHALTGPVSLEIRVLAGESKDWQTDERTRVPFIPNGAPVEAYIVWVWKQRGLLEPYSLPTWFDFPGATVDDIMCVIKKAAYTGQDQHGWPAMVAAEVLANQPVRDLRTVEMPSGLLIAAGIWNLPNDTSSPRVALMQPERILSRENLEYIRGNCSN